MNTQEARATFSLASIFALRMLGLFMILPVFSLYATDLKHATPSLVGLALGVYGLTQALLQIPFGLLSDRFGRKLIICGGLLLFILGSIVAAQAHSIYGIILGRAIQGAGAIGSATMALVADLTRDDSRTKAMAVIGLTIGTAFSIAMVAGPLIYSMFSLQGIFWLTAIFGCLGIAILYTWVPSPHRSKIHQDAQPIPELLSSVIKDKELLKLDFGIFTLHMILTASFIALPLTLAQHLNIHEVHQWKFYLPILLIAFIGMLPMIIIAEKHRKMKPLFLIAIILIALSQLGLWLFFNTIYLVFILLCVFFIMFTFLEASLPSLISKRAVAGSKGTAMGIYSSSQFLGIFMGGFAGGILFHWAGFTAIFLFTSACSILWLLIAMTMAKPQYLATKTFDLGTLNPAKAAKLQQQLLTVEGVAEVLISVEHGEAYLKVDNKRLNKQQLNQVMLN